MLAVFGISIGTLIQLAVAILGISILLSSSSDAFRLIQLFGALYLIYLGIKLMRGHIPEKKDEPDKQSRRGLQIVVQAMLINALNPKLAIFFFTFLPQFVNPENPPVHWQIFMLGLLLLCMGIISDSLYAFLASYLGSVFKKKTNRFFQMQKYVTGILFLLLGIYAALSCGF